MMTTRYHEPQIFSDRHPREGGDPVWRIVRADAPNILCSGWVPAFAGMTMILAATSLLAACGAKGPLERPAGATPVQMPYGATTAPTTDQLLTPPPQTEPTRADDPVRRSRPRADDKFDLPPPG